MAPFYSRFLGPRYMELAKNWIPTAVAFGSTAALAGLYFTDWRVIVSRIPFYGDKFRQPPADN